MVIVKDCIRLLNSMVSSGEDHSETSKKMVGEALSLLNVMEKDFKMAQMPIVELTRDYEDGSGNNPVSCGLYFFHQWLDNGVAVVENMETGEISFASQLYKIKFKRTHHEK